MADRSDLETFLASGTARADDWPLVRLLKEEKTGDDFGDARLEVRRPRSALGFGAAVLYLHFYAKDGRETGVEQEEWDDDLNATLVLVRVRAVDEANEATRFALSLDLGLGKAEARFGDGFFSSVLIDFVRESPFGLQSEIREVLRYVSTNRLHSNGRGYDDCQGMIAATFQERWRDLTSALGYDSDAAQHVIVGALAGYLDERFSVTDRRKLGWA